MGEPTARITLRPIASPLSLGFAALVVASFSVSSLELRWISPAANYHTIGLTVLAFTAPLQFLSAGYGFLARDAVAATGFGILGGVWLAIGSVMATADPGHLSSGLGMFLLASATVLAVPAFTGLGSKLVASTVLVTASARFYLTGAFELTGSNGWRDAAGVCGLVLCAIALYASFAYEFEAAKGRTALPTGRVGRGRTAMVVGVADEIPDLEHEPGVRPEL